MSFNFKTDPDLREHFIEAVEPYKHNEPPTLMPPKRKRTYTRRRNYKRRRYASSTASIAKKMASILQPSGPYGVIKSPQFQKYGPSRQQMMDNPGWSRTAEQTQQRLLDNYVGPGGFWKDVGHYGLRAGGAALGAFNPMGLGSTLGFGGSLQSGWDQGAKISKAVGLGSYNVGRVSNDLIGDGGGDGSTPIYHSVPGHDNMGDVVISNRELVKVVTSSSVSKAFKSEKFMLNPADSTFYHLKKFAEQYEQFEFLGLMFQYVPMTGEGGSNEIGMIGATANYDPVQTRDFTNLEELIRYKGSKTCKASVGLEFGIECDPDKRACKNMYIRDGVSRDKAFTDIAEFHLCSKGITETNATIGQLWVTYSVRFSNIKTTDLSVDSHGSLHGWQFKSTTTIPCDVSTLKSSLFGDRSIIDDIHTQIGVVGTKKFDIVLKRDLHLETLIKLEIKAVAASNRSQTLTQAIVEDISGSIVYQNSSMAYGSGTAVQQYFSASGEDKVCNISYIRIKKKLNAGDGIRVELNNLSQAEDITIIATVVPTNLSAASSTNFV